MEFLRESQHEGVDLGPLIRGLYTNSEKRFARQYRNIFAHAWITYHDDGSVSIMDGRNKYYSHLLLVRVGDSLGSRFKISTLGVV